MKIPGFTPDLLAQKLWGGPRHLYCLTSPPGDSDVVAGVKNHNFLGHKQDQSQDYVVLGLRSKAL